MSVELINDHVLFPFRANYADLPGWERRWETEIAGAEFGHESRYANRAQPRVGLKWSVTARDLQEDAQLIDRIMAAYKSGLACAPCFGRGIELASAAIGTAVEIQPTLYPLVESVSYVIFIDDEGNYDARLVAVIVGNDLTLDSPLDRVYHAGNFCWPLLFGKFQCDGLSALRSEIGEAKLSIAEQVAPASASIGVADPPIDGIGGWIIEDTFIVQ